MTSILEEFAYGNVSPEAQFFKKNSEYSKVMELMTRNEQKLFERLGAEDKDILQKYIDAQMEINSLTAVKNLIYGYKLGLIMTAEAFIGMGDLYADGKDV